MINYFHRGIFPNDLNILLFYLLSVWNAIYSIYTSLHFQKYDVAAKAQLKKWQKVWQRDVNKAADRAKKDVRTFCCHSNLVAGLNT